MAPPTQLILGSHHDSTQVGSNQCFRDQKGRSLGYPQSQSQHYSDPPKQNMYLQLSFDVRQLSLVLGKPSLRSGFCDEVF